MEISSGSDSDDCELYSNAAENVAKKRKIIDAKLENYEKVLNLVNSPDGKHSKYKHLLDDSLPILDLTSCESPLSSPRSSDSSSSDSEDSLSLSELLLRYQNERRGKKGQPKLPSFPKPKSRKSQQATRKSQQATRKSQQATRKKQPRPRPSRRRRDIGSDARILGTVVLDDDSGYPVTNMAPIDFNSRRKNKSISLNTPDISLSSLVNLDSGEDETIESESSTVTIEWKGKERTTRKVFELRRFQKFETIFEDLGKQENIPTSQVLLMHNFDTIRPSDTPSSRNFKHYVALTGCISIVDIDFDKILGVSDENIEEQSNKGALVVKLQQENHTFSVSILKHQNMSVLYEKCLEELKCPENKLKITFDGETVDPAESVADLDLEGGEIFHVYVKE